MSDDLLQEITDLEREIDALRDRRYELKLGLRYARARPLRWISLLMLLRDLERRIYLLRLRYGAAYNGYLQLCRKETRATPPSPAAASRRSPRAPALQRGSR